MSGIVTLQGKRYGTFPWVLDLAHERGLQSITADLVQIPDASNEYTAIVRATVIMKDGSSFMDYGDASPRNVNAKIATALIRMASTRAKGRALRDAVNVGEALEEEMPGDAQPVQDVRVSQHPETSSSAERAQHAPQKDSAEQPAGAAPCEVCGSVVPPQRAADCRQRGVPVAHPRCEAKGG